MLHTYLVVTTEGSLLVKAEFMLDAMMTALFSFDYPESVRVISVADVDSLPEVTRI